MRLEIDKAPVSPLFTFHRVWFVCLFVHLFILKNEIDNLSCIGKFVAPEIKTDRRALLLNEPNNRLVTSSFIIVLCSPSFFAKSDVSAVFQELWNGSS